MRKILVLIACFATLFVSQNSIGQNSLPSPNPNQYFRPVNHNPLDAIRQMYQNRSHQRGVSNEIWLDYAAANGDDTQFAAYMNMDFGMPVDSFGDRYAVVAFDSLHDAVSDIGFEYSQFDSIKIDSLFFSFGHENNSATDDSITLKIVALDNNGYPTSTVLYSISFGSAGGSFTGQPSWLNFVTSGVPINLTLSPPQPFGVQVEYKGAKVDTFGYLYSFVDNGPCAGMGTSYSATLSDF